MISFSPVSGSIRRFGPATALAAILAMAAAACLGPTQFDPTGRAPLGNLEVVRDAAGGIRVSGWALDPETSSPIRVKVGSEGVVKTITANLARPDVASFFHKKGTNYGFDYTFGPLSPGVHGICVWVENTVGIGEDRLLGCENIRVSSGDPMGKLESVSTTSPRTVVVSGWAFDPNTSASSEVVINVDGKLADRITADRQRPDVGAAHGRPRSGFYTDVTVDPGPHQICVATFNVGFGNHRLLGCRDVTVAASTEDRRPQGHLTQVTPAGVGSVLVKGTATDPDGAVGLRVRVDVDGGLPAGRSTTVEVSGGVFNAEVTGLAPGLHTLCPVGLDVDGGFGIRGDGEFICGSTVVGDVAVGTGGEAGNPTWVAPPDGHPLRLTSRDAGVSTQLRDGSTMWFFGDTLEHDNVGDLRYFKNNSAAWAAPGAPTVTRDGVDTSGGGSQPWQFVDAPDFCGGSAYPNAALWPESAVAVAQANGTDRILVFMSKVCLGDEFLEIESRGMALVEFTYDPVNPPRDSRIQGTITQVNLFGPEHPYGRAAVPGDDGSSIYAYECGMFDPDNMFEQRPCTVGRVAFANRTDPGAWTYWRGSAGDDHMDDSKWTSDPALATNLESPTGSDVLAPVAAFTLSRDAVHDAYLMVYSPFPGFTDRVEVRVSTTPVGPFTDPVTVTLPGCDDTTGGVDYRCYAGTAQPSLSSQGLLGVGYYDQLITTSPRRGQYMTVTVPFSVVLTPSL